MGQFCNSLSQCRPAVQPRLSGSPAQPVSLAHTEAPAVVSAWTLMRPLVQWVLEEPPLSASDAMLVHVWKCVYSHGKQEG